MHLSMLSDSYLSDSLAEDLGAFDRRASLGRAHCAGLIRGIVFLAILALPFGLTFGAATLHAATGPHHVAVRADCR